ncbi:unnamed protein product [Rotaria magnacalcarata]|uniref:Small ribosomal subunit protein mS23 n=1 Tax=Rotaria magnacalcarata TaxID=392030 RepID=A0A816SW12_9BILA|nr:unnamed protein product [Rotaria magnacalcarata]CAF1584886.1 unnamed protein product [Rotaria magnacalcarata]CAF2093071.1 unnamed protein product [Rotaria magnacalcarata]CAF2207774.1 unnamed protein product [Rotaria magnacalcarata]CAF3854939.1 unnamed protein product [Rotaria magnacalcarata]
MSRLWKIGSIFSRLSGMVEGGHLKGPEIPIWYSIYKRFPPVREPRFLSLTEGDIPKPYEPPKLLFDEDIIRKDYYEDVEDGEIIKLKNNDRKSRSQVFIDEYFKLKSKQKDFMPHRQLFRLTLEYLQQHGHPIMFKIGAEQKYPEIRLQSDETSQSIDNNNQQLQSNVKHKSDSIPNLGEFVTEWERDNTEGYFPLGKNTYQYRRLQPHRTQTSFGEETLSDSDVTYRRTDGYVHSTVRGDEVKQKENPYMPGENIQPLSPPSFLQQNMLRHGKVHNVFTHTQYEQDPFLRLQDRVKNLEYWKKPPIHTKVFRRKFKAKKFLVDIPGIYEKNFSSNLSSNSNIVDNCPSASNFTQFVHDAQSFLLLLSHIEEIGWSLIRLTSLLNDSMLTLHYTYIDLGDRSHDLYIDIPQRWPNERPRCRTHLPVEFSIETWCPKTSHLIEIINNFRSVVDSLQSFWAQLTELERDAIVLDEKPISCASTIRRLKINDNVHVKIQIDPYNPCAFPSITFHGPQMIVRSFDERLEQNRHHWNEAHSNIILNLEHILDITFPSNIFFKSKSQLKDDQQQECGICYESTLNVNETIIYCETPNCFKQYHEKCWKSWLRKKVPQRGGCDVLDIVVDERMNTTTASGPCLFCKKNIIVN